MKKVYYRKLVRDKIPEVIKSNGGKFETRILKKREFERELVKKLLEEARELARTKRKGLLNELADVLEVIKSLAQYYKIDFKTIESYRARKRRERGGFKKRLFLVWSSEK